MKKHTIIFLTAILLFSCNFKTKNNVKKHSSVKNSELKQDTLKNRIIIKDSTLLSIIKKQKRIEFPLKKEALKHYIYKNDDGYFIDTIVTKNKIENYYSLVENNKLKAFIDKNRITLFGNILDVGIKNDLYKNSNKKTIFPILFLKNNEFIVVGSLIQFLGENDIPGVSFILTTFDINGKMKDNLTIYSRFNWELTLKTDFKTINNINKIEIVNIEEDWLLLDNSGEIVGGRKKPIVKKENKIYELNEKGIFLFTNSFLELKNSIDVLAFRTI